MYWIRIEFLEFLAIRISSCSQPTIITIYIVYIGVYHIYQLSITVVRVYVCTCPACQSISII